MHTEEQAAKCICPIGKMRGTHDGNWDTGLCIGSACMLWRWVPGENQMHVNVDVAEVDLSIWRPVESRQRVLGMTAQRFERIKPVGECRLAGRP